MSRGVYPCVLLHYKYRPRRPAKVTMVEEFTAELDPDDWRSVRAVRDAAIARARGRVTQKGWVIHGFAPGDFDAEAAAVGAGRAIAASGTDPELEKWKKKTDRVLRKTDRWLNDRR